MDKFSLTWPFILVLIFIFLWRILYTWVIPTGWKSLITPPKLLFLLSCDYHITNIPGHIQIYFPFHCQVFNSGWHQVIFLGIGKFNLTLSQTNMFYLYLEVPIITSFPRGIFLIVILFNEVNRIINLLHYSQTPCHWYIIMSAIFYHNFLVWHTPHTLHELIILSVYIYTMCVPFSNDRTCVFLGFMKKFSSCIVFFIPLKVSL